MPDHSSNGSGASGHPVQFSQKCQNASSGRLRKPMDIAGLAAGLFIEALLSLTRVVTTGAVKGSTSSIIPSYPPAVETLPAVPPVFPPASAPPSKLRRVLKSSRDFFNTLLAS